MLPRLLLDTHILIRWLHDPKRLSREQTKALGLALQRGEPVALSAITLLEIAVLVSEGKILVKRNLNELFDDLQGNPAFRVIPLSFEVAAEVGALGILRDPADRTIVATTRVNRLTLVTSDQRIIESRLVPVIE